MLISSNSKNDLILTNLVDTASQIKESGRANFKLAIDYTTPPCDVLNFETMTIGEFNVLTIEEFSSLVTSSVAPPTCTVSFYTDEDRSSLLFTENTTAHSANFTTTGNRTFYTPPDSKLNDAAGISATKAQPTYWVTADFCDGTTKLMTYRNADNMVFPTVRVATKGEPPFSGAGSSLTIYPMGERLEERRVTDSPTYVITKYELHLALAIYNWQSLSEQERVSEGLKATNLMRNALHADRSRGNICTFFSERIYGTWVSDFKVQPSKDMMRGVVTVECCYVSSSTTY